MKILVDMDGIITDTLPAWLERIHQYSGVKAEEHHIVKWNLMENPPLTGLDPKVVFGILNEKDFTLNLGAMADAAVSLKRLHDAGHDISIVTARFGTNCMPETLEWLRWTMPWFDAEKKICFCYDKHRIVGDILIDDKAETLIRYHQEHPNAKLITIDYPYNKHAPADTHRVKKDGYEWQSIVSYIEGMKHSTRGHYDSSNIFYD